MPKKPPVADVNLKDQQLEQEASRFAVHLLMPKQIVLAWAKRQHASRKDGPLDVCNDEYMKAFARDFQVPLAIGVLRLNELGVFP